MLPSEKLAIAARLHVLLRRKTGRVTDTEWMAVNADYAAEIVRHVRERAAEPGFEELLEWAARLEQAVLPHQQVSAGLALRRKAPEPAAVRAAPQPVDASERDSGFHPKSWADSVFGGEARITLTPPDGGEAARYVGRLR
jgi:hypothetical protein